MGLGRFRIMILLDQFCACDYYSSLYDIGIGDIPYIHAILYDNRGQKIINVKICLN